MKHFFTVIVLVTLPGILSPTYGQWPSYIIDDDINLAVSVDVADMIGDTTPELIVTNFSGARLMLYQNNFPDTTWSKDTIAYAGATFAWSGDIDGNDTLDIVACIYTSRAIVWYKNNHPNWPIHYIDTNTDDADFIVVADFNNDDKPDVVTAGAYGQGGDVVWYENNLPDPIWTKHTIESGSERYPSLNVADFDGDGLLDVAATMNAANKVVWFRNDNDTLPWPKYTIDGSLNGAWGINSGDIDGDGIIDIVATGRSDWDVVWYKNNLPDTNWTKHIIDANLSGTGWVDVAYVDGDDTMDVIATGLAGDVVWYENNHPNWVKNTIATDLPQPRVFAVSDVDGDEMNDVIVPALYSVVWYENPYTTGIELFSDIAPTSHILSQNYPNPFNPTTKIKYSLPELSFVTLKIYDVLGSEIVALVKEEKPAGTYEVEFNAKGLPSGVYFYQLNAGEFINTKKMLLLK